MCVTFAQHCILLGSTSRSSRTSQPGTVPVIQHPVPQILESLPESSNTEHPVAHSILLGNASDDEPIYPPPISEYSIHITHTIEEKN